MAVAGAGRSLLVVDGDAADAAALAGYLSRGPLTGAAIEQVGTLDEAVYRLSEHSYDAIVLALILPDSSGLDTLRAAAYLAGSAAIVVLVGPDDLPLAEEAVQNGAQDYLVRGDRRTSQIAPVVFDAIRRERVLTELEMARDAQLREKDRFLSHISHELRSPLAVAYQFGSMLTEDVAGPLTGEQAEMVAVMMRNIDQLQLMIDDLLAASNAQRGAMAIEPVRFDPTVIVAETVSDYQPSAAEHGITLTYLDGSAPEVFADPRRLREILTNLIENSLKYTPKGGQVEVASRAAGEAVLFTVADDGRGVPAKDLPHIFEQFFQSRQRTDARRNGLGLGLYVCRDLVTRQGGYIEARSEPGAGTTVSFTLPMAHAPAHAEASV
jgi:signal transduction histidine kinase